MRCNIYVSNHGKRDGIEDFLTILADIIQKHGYEVGISEELQPNEVNIVIDEFTNAISNYEIKEFRETYPSARLVYVLTEFVEQRWLVRSFNFYGGVLDAAMISVLNIYFRYRRHDFNAPGFRDWIVAALYIPLLTLWFIRHLWKKRRDGMGFQARVHIPTYFLMRYLGLEYMISYADQLVLSHDMIANNIRYVAADIPSILGTLYPEIDFDDVKASLFGKKELFIEVTGSITRYRLKYVDKINGNLRVLGIHNTISACKTMSFSSMRKEKTKRGAYSLHPPQTRNWKYCSPTRIFRALQHDHNLPVLTKVFNQHPIEKVCLQYNGDDSLLKMHAFYKRRAEAMAYLEPRVTEYMEIAGKENNAVVKAIFGCEENPGQCDGSHG